MSDDELRMRMKAWVKSWETTGPILEAMRREEVRKSNTTLRLPALDGMALAALSRFPPGPESGLVQQQRYFMKAHPRP